MPHRRLTALLRQTTLALVATVAFVVAPGMVTPIKAERDPDDPRIQIPDSLKGRSGKLRARFIRPTDGSLEVAPLSQIFGEDALHRPTVLAVRDSATNQPFAFLTMRPFSDKQNGRVGVYQVGRWPSEIRTPRSEAYVPPSGFIEVTESNQELPISASFRLRDFLTKDQGDVWPKYLVLEERLLDKLELVLDELRIGGSRATKLSVLSGFRTPQYNARGRGRATDSRHQYGDAADVFVDANGDGRMDDLNRDGRIDIRDALFFAKAVERVEQRHPELVGGVGIYRATTTHGPFVHVDVRGTRARWGAP